MNIIDILRKELIGKTLVVSQINDFIAPYREGLIGWEKTQLKVGDVRLSNAIEIVFDNGLHFSVEPATKLDIVE